MLTLFQLRESFKDLKKKFNNLKFNYTKKTEKARNLKVLKIQIQQVDTYGEKIQVILESLILVKASRVVLLWPVPRRCKMYCDLPCYSALYPSPSQPLTEKFFTVLFLSFFHFLQLNDLISMLDFSVFTPFILHYFSILSFILLASAPS